MNIKELEKFLKDNPGYLKWGKKKLAKKLNVEVFEIEIAKELLRKREYESDTKDILEDLTNLLSKRILVIADTHIPYEKEGYLEFCKKQYDYYSCGEVIHIGDLIDLHATSFHGIHPNAYSAGNELEYTKDKLKEWYKVFPNMKVIRGNHDDRVFRLAASTGIVNDWIKSFTEVLGVPTWEFKEEFILNDILFTHGTGTSGMSAAYKIALNRGKSVVMGHLHSECSIIYHKLEDKTVFGMIVGSGVDQDSYGMNYAKNFPKKSITACGIILGNQPIIKIMD